MSIQVKVVPHGADIARAHAVPLPADGVVRLTQASQVVLDVPPDRVAAYSREGDDLLVRMKNGETVRIVHFFDSASEPSALFLTQEQDLLAVQFAGGEGAVLLASYAPVGGDAGFESLTAAGAGGAAGGLAAPWLMAGGVALGAGALASMSSEDDRNEIVQPQPQPQPQPSAPAVASNLQISPDGTQISGNAPPGHSVGVDADGDGQVDTVVVVGTDGSFTVTLPAPVVDGQMVAVVVTSPDGASSPPAMVQAPDVTPPAAAANLQVAADGSSLTGTAEAGATVGVDTNGDGVPDVTAVVGSDGSFSVPLQPPLTNGETVTVVVTDTAGNTGPGASVNAPDTTPPTAAGNLQVSADGGTLTGTAEAGATVGVDANGDGVPDFTVVVGGDGSFSVPLQPPLTDGQTLTVVVTDPAGNNSPPTSVQAPDLLAAPIIQATNGSVIAGTSEAGATITLSDGNGAPIGQAVVDAAGNWSFTPATPLPDGTVITAVASNAAGTVSPPATTTVDAVAPAAPVLQPSNGSVVAGSAEAGATVTVTDANGTLIGQATADASGNWSITPGAALPDGTVLSAIATDAAGNASAPATTTVDAVAPATPVLQPSNGSAIVGTAEAGATVIVTDGNGALIGQVTADASGNWSITPGTALPDGTVVNAVASDAAGNASAPATLTVDAVAPAAPVLQPSNGTAIVGTAEAGATVTVTDGNGTLIGQTTADASGNWSVTPGAPLPDGTVINAVATDATGNVSAPGTTTVDTTAPSAPILQPSNGLTIVGSAEAGATVTVTDSNGTLIGQATADASGNWSITPGAALPDGTVLTAIATDAAGNASAPATTTVDAVAPATPVLQPSNGSAIVGTAEAGATVTVTDGNGALIGQVTADASGNWSITPGTALPDGTVVNAVVTDAAGNASAPATLTVDAVAPAAPVLQPSNGTAIVGTAEAGATVTVTDGNGTLIGQTTADASGNWSVTPGAPLPDGTVINAVATDATGNVSAPGTTTVDTTAPSAPILQPSNGLTIVGSAEAGATVTVTDSNGTLIGQATADASGNWSITPGAALPDGTVLTAIATDAAGNASAPATTTIDALAPSAPVLQPSNGSAIVGTAEAGATITVTDSNGTLIGQVTADASGNWSITPGAMLPDGTVVTAIAIDAAGNASAPATLIVDAVAPAAPILQVSNGLAIVGTAEAGATVTVTDGNGTLIGQATADASGNWSITPGAALPDGTVVTAIATDAAGNASAPATLTVDALAPAAPILQASNGVAIVGTAEAGTTVTVTDGNGTLIGQVTADASGNWSVTPGVALPDGTVVTAIATDAAGNASAPATLTVDAVAPAAPILQPSNGVAIVGSAEAGATITVTDGNGTLIGQATADASGNWSVTPGAALPDGTVISAIATDAAGNASPPATLTIDAVAPAAPILQVSNGLAIVGTAEAGATVTVTDGNGTLIGQATADASGNWSVTPGAALPNGTVINAIATDAAGNASAPATLTVDALAPAAPILQASNGVAIVGTAEAGATITVTDGNGTLIGQVTADASGNWSVTPGTALPNGTVVTAIATDVAGNASAPATLIVDAVAPAAPILQASNGVAIVGTAEAGATITVTDGNGTLIGQATADASGNWSVTPGAALPNGTVISAIATDAAGNASPPATLTVDALAPAAPVVSISLDGSLLSGTAEANAQLRVVVNGDTANPLLIQVDGNGSFSLPLSPPLVIGQALSVVAVDAAGNVSAPALLNAPDLSPPLLSVPEAGDTWINAAEIGNGIQVAVQLRPNMLVGQVVTVHFAGQNGYEVDVSHTLTSADLSAGNVLVSVLPPSGGAALPQGAATVTADLNGGPLSSSVGFTIDTVAPATPVLSLVGSLLTISSEPGVALTVNVNVGGVQATATLAADNSGLASLDLLTGLDIDLSWAQLLNAQVSVVGADPAGNPSPVVSLGVGANIAQPLTLGDFGVNFALLPATFGFSGQAEPNATLAIRVITPALNVELTPIQADANGDFALNLLSSSVLNQLGLTASGLLNLGTQVSFEVVGTDTQGNDSARYGITLSNNGASLGIGTISVNGTGGIDILSGADGSSERILAGDGSDLIFNVGSGDQVLAGNGDDTIQITGNTFVSIDGGAGFDTLLFANGIDLDYNAAGIGTLSNIERVDLGKGDSGSTLTLTASEVLAITDSNDTLQITGDGADVLNVIGAVDSGTTQAIDGITYHVYSFGTATLLVEDNTLAVVTA
ncbi:Ig-like domain-containing protein [Xanthomonas sp. PPL139]|uniref:Ig-like domain-containing protein n=1 Tax=unclassified Xanthomonas TaxID=2643310 RepID=UPI0033A208EF